MFIISLYYRCCHFNPSCMPGERLWLGTGLESCPLPTCGLQRKPRGQFLLHAAVKHGGKPCSPQHADSSRQHP